MGDDGRLDFVDPSRVSFAQAGGAPGKPNAPGTKQPGEGFDEVGRVFAARSQGGHRPIV
jgi:hypothetical protein